MHMGTLHSVRASSRVPDATGGPTDRSIPVGRKGQHAFERAFASAGRNHGATLGERHMASTTITRRRLLQTGAAAIGVAALQAVPARPRAADRGRLPAAAAGTFLIGGDLPVRRMGFGAMRVTGPGIWGEPADPAEARKLLRRAFDLGVDLIDTADAYGPEVSERLIREALHPYPQGLVIATKGGLTRPAPEQWDHDGRPEHLRQACEASLRRLRLERIDLYQLHAPDPKVPLADSIGELARLQREG